MTHDNPNRYRISTKFTIVKIFVFVVLFSIVFNVIRDLRNDNLNQKSIFGYSVGSVALLGIIYFVSTRKRIDYDDIKQCLYIVDTKNETETEIPVEQIDRIQLSAIGRGKSSYIITYRDFHNQSQKLRLFTIPFDNSIDTIMTDAKLKNPNVVTRNWTFGWNEFLD